MESIHIAHLVPRFLCKKRSAVSSPAALTPHCRGPDRSLTRRLSSHSLACAATPEIGTTRITPHSARRTGSPPLRTNPCFGRANCVWTYASSFGYRAFLLSPHQGCSLSTRNSAATRLRRQTGFSDALTYGYFPRPRAPKRGHFGVRTGKTAAFSIARCSAAHAP
jgi:hypothetical protein